MKILIYDKMEWAQHSFVGPTHIVGTIDSYTRLFPVFTGYDKKINKHIIFIDDSDYFHIPHDKTYIFINDPFCIENEIDNVIKMLFQQNKIHVIDKEKEIDYINHHRIFLTKYKEK